jgi:hypothetical protein
MNELNLKKLKKCELTHNATQFMCMNELNLKKWNKRELTHNATQFQLTVTSSCEVEILSSTHRYKDYKILYDFGIQSSHRFPLELGLKFRIVQIV